MAFILVFKVTVILLLPKLRVHYLVARVFETTIMFILGYRLVGVATWHKKVFVSTKTRDMV